MIHLIGDYYLTADPHQFIVGKPVERRGKGIEMKSARYCVTLQEAVATAANLALRDKVQAESIKSLQEAVDEMKRLNAELKAAISEMQQ